MKRQRKLGFTLIELSLSIAFIAVLSIIIVLIINNAVSSYRRGIILNQINSTGMDIADELRATIQNSPSAPVVNECTKLYKNKTEADRCINDGARNLVNVERVANVLVGGKSISDGKSNVPVYGALCTGSYSYIWNSAYYFNEDYQVDGASKAVFKYHKEGAPDDALEEINNFRLLKVRDNSRSVCILAVSKDNSSYRVKNRDNYSSGAIKPILSGSGSGNEFTVDGTLFEEPVEVLINDSSNNMMIYDLVAGVPTSNNGGNAAFYSVSFVLGTAQGGINVKATGNFCATPNDFELENFDYCAINKFNIAVQATGE